MIVENDSWNNGRIVENQADRETVGGENKVWLLENRKKCSRSGSPFWSGNRLACEC